MNGKKKSKIKRRRIVTPVKNEIIPIYKKSVRMRPTKVLTALHPSPHLRGRLLRHSFRAEYE